MISEDTIQQINETVDIVQLIGEFTALKKRGNNYIGLCPFHNEKTASFSVNPVKNFYNCFGCGKGGNAVNFIMEHEHLTYPEALRYIADKNNILIEDDEFFKSNKDIYSLLDFASEFFSQQYKVEGNPGAAYALSRGIDNDEFHQGFAKGGKTLLGAALKAGFTQDLLIEAGLLGRSDKGGYDYFIDRLVFPYFDLMGRTIGFTGRVLEKESKYAKYFNSPETPVFKKGKVLFGLKQAKTAISDQDECILVEGQIDVISLHQAGVKNVVCSSGTALSSDQIKLILRFTKNITIMFDQDEAGRKATNKAIDLILAEGLECYVVRLPEGKDPDDFCKSSTTVELLSYIESTRQDWIVYRHINAQPGLDDVKTKTIAVKEVAASVALIADEITRAVHIKRIADLFSVSVESLEKAVKRKLPEVMQAIYSGYYAFEYAKTAIDKADLAIVKMDNAVVVENQLDGKENIIGFPLNPLSKTEIKALAECTLNVNIETDMEPAFIEVLHQPIIDHCFELTKNHFNVMVSTPEVLHYGTEMVSFVDYYIASLVYNLTSQGYSHDDKANKKAVEKAAELISALDNTSVTLKVPTTAKLFGMTAASFTKILKPFLDKKKNVKAQDLEDTVIDDVRYNFDIENLPVYVDKKFFYRYGFFPAQNEQGKKIFYVFRTPENTLVKVGNFFLEPLFQVFDLDPNKNKRIVRLNHAELGRSEYVEMPSSAMMDFMALKKFCWNQGGYIFSKGKPYHHEAILESIALQFPKCYEFSTFGWQPEGFFAFANGIYAEKNFLPVDELGLVAWQEQTYYSPSFSKIFADQRADSDKYINDRFLIHTNKEGASWKVWCELMNQVYKYNDNGKWAILFTILATHRSVIFPIDRFFTTLFFIGPTDSGKSRIAESIRSPFMYGAPLFNLNSGTDAAFFTVMERFRDIPVIFEEYNDLQISDIKFQGLKAAVYDNEGKTKRKEAGTKELDISQVNCAPLVLGQDVPEKDDGSLANRCIMCKVVKKDDWTDQEIDVYNDLKTAEKKGLSNIATAMISKRPEVLKHWSRIQKEVYLEMKNALIRDGANYQTRILNTVSLILAAAKLWETECTEFPLPFTYKEFFPIAKQKIMIQSESIKESNKLASFFDALVTLLNKDNGILEGREFKIEPWKEVVYQKTTTENATKDFGKVKKVLYLRLNILHTMYRDIFKGEALKYSALMTYLQNHPAYIGPVRSTRFSWSRPEEVANPAGYIERIMKPFNINTSALMMDYEVLGIDLEKNLDAELKAILSLAEIPLGASVPSIDSLRGVAVEEVIHFSDNEFPH